MVDFDLLDQLINEAGSSSSSTSPTRRSPRRTASISSGSSSVISQQSDHSSSSSVSSQLTTMNSPPLTAHNNSSHSNTISSSSSSNSNKSRAIMLTSSKQQRCCFHQLRPVRILAKTMLLAYGVRLLKPDFSLTQSHSHTQSRFLRGNNLLLDESPFRPRFINQVYGDVHEQDEEENMDETT